MKELRPSKFNVLASTTRHRCILYNTLSRAAVEVPIDSYPEIMYSLENRDAFHKLGFIALPEEELAALDAHMAQENDSLELSVTWYVTRECNFACVYCYQDRNVSDQLIDVQEVFSWLVGTCGEGKSVMLTLFGGEPLLRLDRITDFLCKLRSSGIEIVSSIVTNGWFLTPSVARTLSDLGVSRFQVTLDGYGASHDCRRPTAKGEPTFGRVFENVVHALRWMEGTIRINWDRENIESLNRLVQSIASSVQNPSKICLDFRYVFYDKLVANTSHVDNIYHQITEPLGLAKNFGLQIQNPLSARLCYGRRTNAVVVDDRGRLFSCNITAEEPRLAMGTVRDPDVDGLTQVLPVSTKCFSCCYFPVCGGGCIYGDARHAGSGCRWNELEHARQFILPFCY